MLYKEVEALIEKCGIPSKDLYELPTSKKRFADGCQYRLEVSGVERLSTLRALVDEMEKRDIPIHRIIATVMGSTLLSDDELSEYAKLANEAKLEVIVTPGPRRAWDLGAQSRTTEGGRTGNRIRGCDNLKYLITDIMRSIRFGFRGFLVWDEGVLWLLNEMRKAGDIPKNTIFKLSTYAGHANPAGARVLETLGANSFNPVGDLTLPMLAAIRKVVSIPIDVYVYVPLTFGGMNRLYETPQIVGVAAPCYIKFEPGESEDSLYQPWVSEEFHEKLVRQKVRWAGFIKELVEENFPEAKLSKKGETSMAIPQP